MDEIREQSQVQWVNYDIITWIFHVFRPTRWYRSIFATLYRYEINYLICFLPKIKYFILVQWLMFYVYLVKIKENWSKYIFHITLSNRGYNRIYHVVNLTQRPSLVTRIPGLRSVDGLADRVSAWEMTNIIKYRRGQLL